jgi:hypothetical protein
MIRHALPSAVAALALAAPLVAQAQMTAPVPATGIVTNANVTTTGDVPVQPVSAGYSGQTYAQPMMGLTNANAAMIGQPQPGSFETQDETQGQVYAQPAIGQAAIGQPVFVPSTQAPYAPVPGAAVRPFSPRTTWIPGNYNWDSHTSNYVWTEGQYIEAPTQTAQWVPGHWSQTPSSWVWVNGGWRD